MTTLSDELDKLRENICHDCKKKFVPGNVCDPPSPGRIAATPSTDLPPTNNTNAAISASSVAILLSTSETTPGTAVDTPAMNPGPEFSVEYNPEVKRSLALHLEHVFAHENPAFCMKISPDGQGMAVGFQNSGATIINGSKTRSNVRSVSECLAGALD